MASKRGSKALAARDSLTNLARPDTTLPTSKSKATAAHPRKRTLIDGMPFPDFAPSSQPLSSPSTSSPPRKKQKPTGVRAGRSPSARTPSSPSFLSSPGIPTQRSTSATLAASGTYNSSTLIADDDDDEPFSSVFDILMGPPAGPSRSQALEAKNEPQPPAFRPTALPPGVSIGDAIYANRSKNYWPAVLTGFQPAQTLEQQKLTGDRYEVEFELADFGTKSLRRRDVIFMTDEGIADCTLGVVKTQVIEPRPTDAEEREDTPTIDIPESQQAFSELDRRDQLLLCRPHLAKIIAESYDPAQWRIDSFFDPKKKQKLRNQVMMGDILEHEVTGVIIPELQRWALRDPRPTGSERYEALSAADMRSYIDLVLLPEAVIHICIRSLTADELRETDPALSAENDAVHSDDDPDPDRRLYDDARAFLKRLRETDTTQLWASRIEDLKSARRRMRQRRGLEPEEYDRVQNRQQKQMDAGARFVSWTGRFRRVMGAQDATDASCNQTRWKKGGRDVLPMQ